MVKCGVRCGYEIDKYGMRMDKIEWRRGARECAGAREGALCDLPIDFGGAIAIPDVLQRILLEEHVFFLLGRHNGHPDCRAAQTRLCDINSASRKLATMYRKRRRGEMRRAQNRVRCAPRNREQGARSEVQ